MAMQSDEDVEDPEIHAKEAAMQKVAKLLPLPDSLASLKRIRDDYASRLQVQFDALSIIIFHHDIKVYLFLNHFWLW